ncbi:MAG: SPOR domain-containing protein [Treponema sp.]|nr:SPOR domain-containing protein [Treponema sp.]
MRRFIFSLLIISLTVSLTFATSKPSLDGRAVVAEEGVLPAGLFAKTVGYLPGDSVSVTNPATGITINVLILGSIDPSAGVAILLSPEAADKLFITPDSNTQVKITKRTGMLDEAGSGTGTLVSDTPSDTLLPNQVKDDLDSKLSSLDETLGTASTTEDMAEDTTEASLPETTEETEALAITTPEASSEIIPEEDVAIPEEIAPLPTETTAPEAEAQDEVSDYNVTAVEEVPMNHVLAEHDPVYIVESLSEDPFTGFETEPELAEVSTEEEPAEEITEADASEEAEEIAEEIVLIPAEPEMEASEEWPYTEDTSLADEYLAADDSSLVDPFAPIILVPAEENPPADENPPEETTPVEEAVSTFVPVPVENKVVENVTPSSITTNQKGMVKSLSELESGKYYVQVATFAEQENIDRLLKEYGSKYPFVMVPLKSGKAMQMMVGPLNVDEYGAVLARFKNLGFKDSFLRKIR